MQKQAAITRKLKKELESKKKYNKELHFLI